RNDERDENDNEDREVIKLLTELDKLLLPPILSLGWDHDSSSVLVNPGRCRKVLVIDFFFLERNLPTPSGFLPSLINLVRAPTALPTPPKFQVHTFLSIVRSQHGNRTNELLTSALKRFNH